MIELKKEVNILKLSLYGQALSEDQKGPYEFDP